MYFIPIFFIFYCLLVLGFYSGANPKIWGMEGEKKKEYSNKEKLSGLLNVV